MLWHACIDDLSSGNSSNAVQYSDYKENEVGQEAEWSERRNRERISMNGNKRNECALEDDAENYFNCYFY